MLAMVLEKNSNRLIPKEVPQPLPGPDEILIKIGACGVCRTDLHIVDGELDSAVYPVVPGHEIVGTVVAKGERVHSFEMGDRVGVPWLGYTCGKCVYCLKGRENLCSNPKFTGYTVNGGYAEYTVANQNYCFRIPEEYSDPEAAPLLCAGLIGYRSLTMTGDAEKVGIYGFGAAAHIITQVAVFQGRKVFAFTRPGDEKGQDFAKRLGAVWAGGSDMLPPERLDAAIIFAPVGALVPLALKALDKGGIVVCAGIHMSDIPSFSYDLLWEERSIKSVANLTRDDGEAFMAIAPRVPVRTQVTVFPLTQANEALDALRAGKIKGAAVLVP